MKTQKQERPQSDRYSLVRLIILMVPVFLVFSGTFVAIWSIYGTSLYSWYAILSLLLTDVGILVGLFPFFSRKSEETSQKLITSLPKETEYELLREKIENDIKPKCFGAIVIYASKALSGTEVYSRVSLPQYDRGRDVLGFHHPDWHSTFISEYNINHSVVYAAIFNELRPEIYHVWLSPPRFSIFPFSIFAHITSKYNRIVTVEVKQVTLVDLR